MRSLLLALLAVAGLSSCPSLGPDGEPLDPFLVASATLGSAQQSAFIFAGIYQAPGPDGFPLDERRAETWRQVGAALGAVAAAVELTDGDVGEAVREAYEALVPLLQDSNPEIVLYLTALYAGLDILRITYAP